MKYRKEDIVKVVKPGHVYSLHISMFRTLGFKNKVHNLYDPRMENDIWQIFNVCKNVTNTQYVYAIVNQKGDELLIGENGLCRLNLIEATIYKINQELKN